jgi:hypothetical protein
MAILTVEAESFVAANALCLALSGFEAELADDEGCRVRVVLHGGDGEMVALLNTIQRHVTDRMEGPALIGLNGSSYTLSPA